MTAGLLAGLMACSPVASLAQDAGTETSDTGGISLELNAAVSNDGSCTLSFLAENGYDADIEQVVYETVLFDTSGQVSRLTLFDFGTLPADRPRVRQFSLSGTSCEDLGRILVNGADTCTAPDLPDGACLNGMTLNTRTEIEMIG